MLSDFYSKRKYQPIILNILLKEMTTDINFKSCILEASFWGLAEKVYHHGFHSTIHIPLMLSLNTTYTS